MSGFGRRFDPGELHDDAQPMTDAEAASLLAAARDLETFAASESVTPTVGFEDRVMAAIATEAPPRPVVTGGFLAGFVTAVRDAWRITWSGGRPLAVRAQALALVLLVVVAVGSVGTVATIGAMAWLQRSPVVDPDQPPATPTPSDVAPTLTPEPSLSPAPSPTLAPSPSPSPSSSTEPSESPEASETPEGTNGGSSGSSTARPSRTPRPTADETEDPDETEHPDDTPKPSKTPHPEDTPDPDETPDPDD